MWHGAGVEQPGCPRVKVTDGPVGARGTRWVGTTSAARRAAPRWGPPGIRTWSARSAGCWARRRPPSGANVLLAPTVNLHRSPLAGRNFECFSEDPWLTARLAVAYIEGVQSTGVGACIKHLVANDSEFERHTISSEVTERVLRELYLVPFEAAVAEADVVVGDGRLQPPQRDVLRRAPVAADRRAEGRVGLRGPGHLRLVGGAEPLVDRGRPGPGDARPGGAHGRPRGPAGP